MSKLKVAVVGLGIGRQHIKHWLALADYYDIALVCDVDAERCRQVAGELGCPSTSLFDDVLQAGVDVIDVCTPPHLHFEMVNAALQSGHHVVCEKPRVNSVAQVDQLIEIANKAKRHLMPISQYRYGAGVQRLNYLQQQGLLGECYVASVETHWHRDHNY